MDIHANIICLVVFDRIGNGECSRSDSEEQKNTPCLNRLPRPYMPYAHQRKLPHRQRVGALPQHNLPTEIKYRQTQYHSSLDWGDSPLTSLRQGISHWANWETGNCKVTAWLVVATEPVIRWETNAVWAATWGEMGKGRTVFITQ